MPSSKPSFFFASTQSVDDRLGDVFSFTWASYTGLRDLWWQVRGFQNEFPSLHIKEVEKKFLSGLPLHGGVDLKKICLETSWEEHEKEFAKWLLFDACTLYEGWAEKVCFDIFPPTQYEENAKRLQWPPGVWPYGRGNAFTAAIAAANSNSSALMITEFLPTLRKAKLNCLSEINENLAAYRYFKECRNNFIHSDGVVTQDIVDLRANVKSIQETTPSPFKHSFNLPNQIVDKKIELDIRDCILFATLVRKLICTLDAELCVAAQCEIILENRLKKIIAQSSKWQSLPADPKKKEQRVHRLLSASRIPEPVNFNNIMLWMQAKNLI